MLRLLSFLLVAIISTQLSFAQPIRVIVETDMGNDVDDVLAVDVLYKMADAGRATILGVSNHKKSDYASDYISMLNRWYGYSRVPVAQSSRCVVNDKYTDYTKVVSLLKDEKGRSLFGIKHRSHSESVDFYRRVLAREQDSSVVIVSLGFATNLAMLLDSKPDKHSDLSGRELVARKVRLLSIMAGSFGPKARAEYNVVNDLAACRQLFEQWPSEIVVNPFEIGKKIPFPATVIENELGWAKHHPLVESYKAYNKMPYNRPTWDVESVLYPFAPQMFTCVGRGVVRIDDKGYMSFVPDADGRHLVLSVDDAQAAALQDYIVKLVTDVPTCYRHNK